MYEALLWLAWNEFQTWLGDEHKDSLTQALLGVNAVLSVLKSIQTVQ